MLQTHHHDCNHIAALEAQRLRRAEARDLERVVTAAARGDQSAWSALVARFRGRILRVTRAHGLNHHQADDVAQETWLRLFRNVGGVRNPEALGAWIDTTARRESLRAIRGGRREDLTGEELGVEVTTPDDPDAELLQERRAELASALEQLPEHQRRLIESLIGEPEPTYAAVAEQLGLPIGSIGPTRGRCVKRLRHIVAPELEAAHE
jgi:RNA polymerase sigma factor (sigma-70 family)